jgi:uncharacterized protein (DUF1810 family)
VTDTSTISRFLEAQNADHPSAYDRALAELRAGRKRSHWIWFVLPQLQGLGRSAMAQHYGINGLEEAKAYLEEPTLRSRLEEVIGVIAEQLQKPDQSLERLMGGNLDATKTISCLTLFQAADLSRAHCLLELINIRCERTMTLIGNRSQSES